MDSRDLRNLAEAWESITTPETETEQLDEQRLSGPQRRERQAEQQAAAAQSRQKAGEAVKSFADRGGLIGAFGRALEKRRQEVAAQRQLKQDEAESRAQARRLGDAPARETGMPRPAAPAVTAKPAPVAAKPATAPADTAPTKPDTAPADAVKPKRPSIADELRALRAMRAASVMRQQGQKINGRIPTGADVQAASKTLQDLKKGSQYLKQDADLFDIVKGHLMSEGATEEEALKRMAVMTEEERNEIVESSCGSGYSKKKKKKSGY
jgi:hypothetical protein